MKDILIRKEVKDDYNHIHKINVDAFNQPNEAKLVDLLRSSNTFIPELSLVAELNNEIVGHILFTKIKIVNKNDSFKSLALAPMAVDPKFQKAGIGSLLVNEGLKKATELSYNSVIVLGHKHYYSKFGFKPAKHWNINCPFEVPLEVFMAIELIEDGLKNVSGTVQYAEEFELV